MSFRNLGFTLIIATAIHLSALGQGRTTEPDRIQMALLLDISGSMDRLIAQAKSQLWKIANYLNGGTKHGKKVTIEFALITYGGPAPEDNYTTIMAQLTPDLDSLSEKLHQIQIGGGKEHCWAAIDLALQKLRWSPKKGDLRILLIAGNESFHQGDANPKTVIRKSKKLNVIINTIYCNAVEDSVSNGWKNAAVLGRGSYFTIAAEDSLMTKENFMDKKLAEFNDKLNATYVPYGALGEMGIQRMVMQDKNAKLTGMPFFRERVAYKAGGAYHNPSWDLVDAYVADSTVTTRITSSELADELRSLNLRERNDFLESKLYTRQSYQEAIRLRYGMITKYLGEGKGKSTIDSSIKEIVNKEGKKKRFSFD